MPPFLNSAKKPALIPSTPKNWDVVTCCFESAVYDMNIVYTPVGMSSDVSYPVSKINADAWDVLPSVGITLGAMINVALGPDPT